jgi:hypothetical protein
MSGLVKEVSIDILFHSGSGIVTLQQSIPISMLNNNSKLQLFLVVLLAEISKEFTLTGIIELEILVFEH